jgi:hypothetical protein
MTRIEEHADIAASSSIVFRFCHDISRRPEWDERVLGMQLLNSSIVRQGALFSVDADAGGLVFSWEGEYIAFQFPRHSKVRVMDAALSSPFSAGSEEWEFSSVGGSTHFNLVWEYQPRGFLGRITDALWRRAATRRAVRRSLDNLKEIIETG